MDVIHKLKMVDEMIGRRFPAIVRVRVSVWWVTVSRELLSMTLTGLALSNSSNGILTEKAKSLSIKLLPAPESTRTWSWVELEKMETEAGRQVQVGVLGDELVSLT